MFLAGADGGFEVPAAFAFFAVGFADDDAEFFGAAVELQLRDVQHFAEVVLKLCARGFLCRLHRKVPLWLRALCRLVFPGEPFSNTGRTLSRMLNMTSHWVRSLSLSARLQFCHFARWTDEPPTPGTNSQASSAVNARIGASISHSPVTSRCNAVCVERRRGELAASV